MFWIRRLWVELVSLLASLIILPIAAYRLGGWTLRAARLGGVILFIVALVSAVRKIREEHRRRQAQHRRRQAEHRRREAEKRFHIGDAVHRSRLAELRRREEESSQIIDRNVRFTVYRPERVRPEVWYTMLAFAYRAADAEEGGGDIRESLKEVEHRAASVLGDQIESYESRTADSRQDIPREGTLRFVPRFEGLDFNPPERSFLWVERVHQESFRFRAPREVDGGVVHGRMEVYLGVILIAEIGLTISVDSGAEAPEPEAEPRLQAASHGRPYRRIFASYSHKNLSIVRQFEVFVEAFGDEFMRDWTHLKAGEVWSERLQLMISEADIFQLFWSRNSMESDFVRQEWEYALGLGRPSFVRPVYWEEPMPENPDKGLPPELLRQLHFHRLLLPTPALDPGRFPEEPLVEEGLDEAWRMRDQVLEARQMLESIREETRSMLDQVLERTRMLESIREETRSMLDQVHESRQRFEEIPDESRLRTIRWMLDMMLDGARREERRLGEVRRMLETMREEANLGAAQQMLETMQEEARREEARLGEARRMIETMRREAARMVDEARLARQMLDEPWPARQMPGALEARVTTGAEFETARAMPGPMRSEARRSVRSCLSWLVLVSFLLLLLARVTNLITWPWWSVLTPLLIPVIVVIVILLVALIETIRERF
jgi:hypothetical protein